MVKLSIVVAVLTVLALHASGEKIVQKRDTIQVQVVQGDDAYKWFCDNNPFAAYFDICKPYLSSTTSTTTKPGTTIDMHGSTTNSYTLPTTTTESSNTPSTPTNLERAHWCSFSNGSYIPLGYTFMYSACAICQCTQSRAIRCNNLQCMDTFCIDNSVPSRRPGQCCTQCAYDVNSTACIQNGISFPHG